MVSDKIKRLVKSFFHSFGLDVRLLRNVVSEESALKGLLAASRPQVILDVGANVGQFAQLVRRVGFGGKIVSFEALSDVHASLELAARNDPMWKIAPCAALGSETGELQINVAGNSVSSSLLPMHERHRAAAPESKYVATRIVRVERLDDLALPFLNGTDRLLIKVDTQGYERKVLEGAEKLLPNVSAMQIELSLVPLYEGAPALAEMIVYAERQGFEMFSLIPGFRDGASGRLLQVDGFFIKKEIG